VNVKLFAGLDGRPLLLYHGTDFIFKHFRSEYVGINSEHDVHEYGFHFSASQSQAKKFGRIVRPFYLSLVNPFVVPFGCTTAGRMIEVNIFKEDLMLFDASGALIMSRYEITCLLRAHGFDGVIKKMSTTDQDEYIVFETSQIMRALLVTRNGSEGCRG
jgi:hypothetical protein